jgi:predicted TIM-barrel fold metal-dependent hydrolase
MAYREQGPVELEPVGEVDFASAQAESAGNGIAVAQAVIGWADLALGDAVDPVLAALEVAGRGRFRGVRTRATYDPDPVAGYGEAGAPAGLLAQADYRRGVARLHARGLVLDMYAFHTQLGEVADLARAFPDLPIVLNHIGGPLGVGVYAGQHDKVFADWTLGINEVATCPNVSIKIGGFAISRIAIVKAGDRARPFSSTELADAFRPWVDHCLGEFGPERCLFGSNFPVDKVAFPLVNLVNAMKIALSGHSLTEQRAFFAGNARKLYTI